MKKTKKHSTKQVGDKFIIKTVLIGSVIGIICFFALLAIFALIALKQDLSEEYYWILTIVASAVSSFIGGFSAVRPIRKNGLILGMASVIPLFLVVLTVASIVNRTGISMYGWIALGVMLLFGAGAGVFAANKRQNVKIK